MLDRVRDLIRERKLAGKRCDACGKPIRHTRELRHVGGKHFHRRCLEYVARRLPG